MGNHQSRRSPLNGTPAHYMLRRHGAQTCRFLAEWHKDTYGAFPEGGTFNMDQIILLREVLLFQKSRPGQWRAFSFWFAEASERQHESQARRSKDTQEKLEAQLASSKDAQEELVAQLANSKDAQRKLVAQLANSEFAQGKLAAQLADSEFAQRKLATELADSKDAQEELEAEVADLKAKFKATSRSKTSGPVALKPSAEVLPAPWQQLPEGEPFSSIVCERWISGELLNLRMRFSDIREQPEKFKKELGYYFQYYNPRWADVNRLLSFAVPFEVRVQLTARARWPATDPGREDTLMLARQCLLWAILKVCPKKTDWSKILYCKQEEDETPADFMKRLKTAFEQYSGIAQPTEKAPELVTDTFVRGLQPETRYLLKDVEWRAFSLSSLVPRADLCDVLQKRERWQCEDQALQRWSGFQGGRRRKGQGRRFMGCYNCKEFGHWRNECPY